MDIKDFLRVIRARWVVIVLSTVLGSLLALGYAFTQPKIYTADSSGIVQSAQNDSVSASFASSSLASQRVASYVELGKLRAVAEYAIEELNLETSPESLVSRVNVTNPTDTLVIRVEASAASPEEARDLAEAWVRGMAYEVNELETGNREETGGLRLAQKDSAELPSKPSSPNYQLIVLIGLVLGFAIGMGIALIRNHLDRRVRSTEDVEREVGAAVIGAVPVEKSMTHDNRLIVDPKTGASDDSLFAVSEALRSLRTNIQFADVDNPPRVLVVSSPLPGDGKSTIAANLAMSLSANGQPTVLIDADLRRPMQTTIFNLPEGSGLTDVLAGRAGLDEVANIIGDSDNLIVITAGSIPPNPSEILGSERMHQLLNELREEAMVIVDAPPVIPVTDAAVLSNHADGAIIVATVGTTTYDLLSKAIENITKVSGRVLGIVLNRVPKKGMGAAYYGYQYTGKYYQNEKNSKNR